MRARTSVVLTAKMAWWWRWIFVPVALRLAKLGAHINLGILARAASYALLVKTRAAP